MKKEMICIVCPMGCHLSAELDNDNNVLSIQGNTCPRGKIYAERELTHPTRMLTTTVAITNRPGRMLPVKTASPISKEKIFAAMEEIRNLSIAAPVKSGTVILSDLVGETDLISTGNIE